MRNQKAYATFVNKIAGKISQKKHRPENENIDFLRQELTNLQCECKNTKEELQSIINQHKNTNEKLQMANKKNLLNNEEQQNTIAKLEASQEELKTINQQLHDQNLELDRLNNDLNNIFSNLTIPLIIIGNDLRIRSFTPVCEKLFHFVPSDIGRHINYLNRHFKIADLELSTQEIIDGLAIKELEIQDLAGCWYSVKIRPYKTKENKIEGAVLTFFDIHELKSDLEESLDYARGIVETARECILILDAKLRVKTANPTFYHTFKISHEETEGRFIYELGKGNWNIPKLRELLEQILPKDHTINDFNITHNFSNLGRKTIQINARRLYQASRKTGMILLTLEDITERKAACEEMLRVNEELKRSNKELETFAYVASHDLKEPIRMIISYTQLLQNRYKDKISPEANQMIQYAVEASQRMNHLINDLLEYSRVRTRRLDLKEVNCEEVLKNVLSNLQIAIKEANASITHDPLPTITVDEAQLGQIFQNLLSNALKFRSKTCKIHISVREKDAEWIFSVHDNGIGIDSNFFDQIFTVFQRLHSREEYPGTGIGLAICKNIIHRHGGKIWVESTAGNGSTFYFSLPKSSGSSHLP